MSDADRPRVSPEDGRGAIAWMVRNPVPANLLMWVLLGGGVLSLFGMQQEVFPEIDLDQVTVQVTYEGSSPEEVEQGIVLAIEEEVRSLADVKQVRSVASEGSARVTLELLEGADAQRAFQDVQQAVARIRSFPEDAEEPRVSLSARRREVLEVHLYGDVDEWVLRELVEQVRDRLLQDPEITQIGLEGARRYEIHIEVSQANLRRYGLTLGEIARIVDATAVDVPGGRIETSGGELLLRVKERRDWAHEFAQLPVRTTADGSVVRLGDLGRVTEGFEEVSRSGSFNGKRAIGFDIFRVGEQTPQGVSDAVRRAMAEIAPDLPPGVDYVVQDDRSQIYSQRVWLLIKNLAIGLILVLAVLTLFLEPKLAFWVTMGIPIAFVGSLLFLPALGVTINMISLFAFLIALGIVVDDAIVTGENVHEQRQRGLSGMLASIRGARGVASPVTFSILTNIVAFTALAFVPGRLGKIWASIPIVVTVVFLLSWLESLFILPAHLRHAEEHPTTHEPGGLRRFRERFQARFAAFASDVYGPVLMVASRSRYLTAAIAVGLLVVLFGYVGSGRMGMTLMPRVESDRADAEVRLPIGSPDDVVESVRDRMVAAAMRVVNENGGDALSTGVFANVDDHRVRVAMYLTSPDVRPISTTEVAHLWRDALGPVTGVESLRFQSDRGGPGGGRGLTVELSHRDVDVLDRASQRLALELEQFASVTEVDDGFSPGKPQLNFKLRPEARSLGLTSADVARQVRASFQGAQALRQQRGRSEVRVRVRLPWEERVRERDLEQLLIRTPGGGETPLWEIAEVDRGRAYTEINRRDGRRTLEVTADVVPRDQVTQVLASLQADVLPQLQRDFPGLGYSFEGRQAEMRDSLVALGWGFVVALLVIYVLLAVPFRSYLQPLIVLLAIPFGVVGATLGHLIMGYSLSVISMMGMVALAGVVVNDSLIMVDYANGRRREGVSAREAIHDAGLRRFRPIVLTTLTTFGGLAPMIFETSRQARFMIPMAISLGYGILFATAITLLLVPALYLILEDLRGGVAGLRSRRRGRIRPLPDRPGALGR